MNVKNNANYKNSQKLIQDAFFHLLKQKGVEGLITVSDVVRESGVNRSTFYRHYLDVQDLCEKICIQLQSPCFAVFFKSGKLEDFIRSFLAIVDENKLFFRYYMLKNPNQFQNPDFHEVWSQSIVPIFLEHGVKDEESMKYYYSYFTAGMISIIRIWIQGGCKESKEKIFEILRKCLKQSNFQLF